MKFILISSLIFFSACNTNKISNDTLVKIYADIVIAQDTTSGASSNPAVINNLIFQKYNVSEKDYETSIRSMESNPESWDIFFDKVVKHVENLRKKEKNNSG
ncbi:MAG: DUF4296 domain-containing protein [Ignavibacteriaceae bacterium]